MASYEKSSKPTKAKTQKGHTYLEKKKFLDEEDRTDKTIVTAEVRQFEYGGSHAFLSVESPGSFNNTSWYLSCNPDDKDSKAAAFRKADYMIECINEWKKAVRDCAAA